MHLGNQPTAGSSAFLRELFLQCLPGNVRMVLASTDESLTIDQLAELADRIVAVATLSVSAVGAPQLTTEVEHLRAASRGSSSLSQANLSFHVPPDSDAHPAQLDNAL